MKVRALMAALSIYSASALSAGLELDIAKATPMGPQLTTIDGCYVVSKLADIWHSEIALGYTLRDHLRAIDDASLQMLAKGTYIKGMAGFLGEVARRIHEGRHLDKKVSTSLLGTCRKHEGKTWELVALPWK